MSSDRAGATKTRTTGRPRGDTGDSTRGDILDAALKAFAETGFGAMSVRELTRQLGVSHNLVHHHFGSKEHLWRAALDHGVGSTADELTEIIRESVGSPRSREVLQQVLQGAWELLTRRPEIARIFADESARPGPRLDYLYDKYLGPTVELLSRFLHESRAYGVRDVDSRVAALFVLSSASARFTHAALAAKLGVESGAQTDALADLVLGGLLTSESESSNS